MNQLFKRKPISDLLADSEHSLKRVLGAGDLVMLAIGAVIGAGIFSSIGTAASPYRRTPALSPSAWARAVPNAIPTSSTVWWASMCRSPLHDTLRSNRPCRARWVSMWSKNPTPVFTSERPVSYIPSYGR